MKSSCLPSQDPPTALKPLALSRSLFSGICSHLETLNLDSLAIILQPLQSMHASRAYIVSMCAE